MFRFVSLLLFAAVASAQGREVTVHLEKTLTATAQPRILFPQYSLRLRPNPPAGMPKVPGLTEEARYAQVYLGNRPLFLAFDTPEDALALGLLYPGTRKSVLGKARAGSQGGLLVDFRDVEISFTRVDVRLQYSGPRLARAGLQPAWHRRGRIVLGGELREVILIDSEGDGVFNGPDDRWIALLAERKKEARTLAKPDAMLLSEPKVPFEPDGRALMVRDVKADGFSLVLRIAEPAMTLAAVLERRYIEVRAGFFEKFKREREAFSQEHGIDASRKRTFKPAPWLSVPLSQARRYAKEANKPLLVFYVTESNQWCFRYDFYTFPDEEVDRLLKEFVLVRIDAEKDEEKSYARIGSAGIPCLVPFTADGKPIAFQVRNRDHKGRPTDFEAKEQLIIGWRRPDDLAVNLRRILGR